MTGGGYLNGISLSSVSKVVTGAVGVGAGTLFLYTANQIDDLRTDVNSDIRTIETQASTAYTELARLRAELEAGLRLVDTQRGLASQIDLRHEAMLERLTQRVYELELTVNSGRRRRPSARQPQE